MNGKILPKNTLTNFDMMYRDLAHGPTPNYNISCSGNQASVHGMRDGHPHQVRRTMVPQRPNSTRSFNGDIILCPQLKCVILGC